MALAEELAQCQPHNHGVMKNANIRLFWHVIKTVISSQLLQPESRDGRVHTYFIIAFFSTTTKKLIEKKPGISKRQTHLFCFKGHANTIDH